MRPLAMRLIDFMNLQKNAATCRLCMQSLKPEHATPSCCEHAFHIDCLKKWTDEKKTESQCKCPMEKCGLIYTAISIRNSLGGPIRENISLAIDTQCPICCEDIQPPVASPESCNHHFCVTCLSEWAKVRHECPLDRGPFQLMLLSSYIGGPVIERRPAPPAYAPPPEEEDTTVCEICNSPEDEAHLLLCDGCDKGYHTYCLPTPLSEIPEGDWFCPNCGDHEENTLRDEEASMEGAHSRRASRQPPFPPPLADLSAEEASSSEESPDDGCLSTQSQERLARIAERRHRGTGLLRDLIQHLSIRAEREQQERRRNRRLRQRRRVRLAESFSEISPLPGSSTISAISSASALMVNGGSRNIVRVRKRRRIVGFSSDSEEEEKPSCLKSPSRNENGETSSFVTPPSHRQSQSTPLHSPHERPLRHTPSESAETDVAGPSDARANDSGRDIFASFATDPNISSTVEEIHEIAQKKGRELSHRSSGTSKGKRKKRRKHKVKRRLKTPTSNLLLSARQGVRRSRASSEGRKAMKRKRPRHDSFRDITQDSSKSLTPSSTVGHVGRKTRRKDLKLATPRLSILGNELDCGLNPESEDDSEKKAPGPNSSNSRVAPSAKPTPPVGLLSRLEADQTALFHFRTSNMRVNPDNSLSPVRTASPPRPRRTETVSGAGLAQGPPLPPSSSRATAALAPTPSGSNLPGCAKLPPPPNGESAPPSVSNLPPSASTWTSEEALRVRSLLAAHLHQSHPSITDKATKMRLIQRALSKILAKKPNRVTEEKMRKLVDDYVEFYRRNPP